MERGGEGEERGVERGLERGEEREERGKRRGERGEERGKRGGERGERGLEHGVERGEERGLERGGEGGERGLRRNVRQSHQADRGNNPMTEYAKVAAITLQLCGWQPTPQVVEDVYSVWFHAPKPGHSRYVATAMCEARDRVLPGAQICQRVNNVCLND